MTYRTQLSGIITLALAFSSVHAHQKSSFNSAEAFHWSGIYLGAYLGGAQGHSTINTNVGTVNPGSYFTNPLLINFVEQNGSSAFNQNSAIGGIQWGGNWVYRNVIYGFIMDYGSLNLNKTVNVTSNYPDNSGSYSQQTTIHTDWLFTVRARLGLTQVFSKGLIYVTGGLASTQIQVSNNFNDTTSLLGLGTGTNNNAQAGWTVGGGVELPITKNLSVNGEYLHLQLNSGSVTSSITNSIGGNVLTSPFISTANLHANLIRIGLNYKFSGREV